MKKVILLFSLLTTLIYSCTKDEKSPGPDPLGTHEYSDEIEGNWSWFESSGGISGEVNTPESVGYNVDLVISIDSLIHLKNRIIQNKREYLLKVVDDPAYGGLIDILEEIYSRESITDSISNSYTFRYRIYKDTLLLFPYNIACGESQFYVRN